MHAGIPVELLHSYFVSEPAAPLILQPGDTFTGVYRFRGLTTTPAAVSIWVLMTDPGVSTRDQARWVRMSTATLATTTFASTIFETAPVFAALGGECVYAVATINADGGTTIGGTGDLWLFTGLINAGVPRMVLASGWFYSGKTVNWNGGIPNCEGWGQDSQQPGTLFIFQGTVVNGAGGAGDNSLTVVAGAGGRVEIESFQVINQDTAARTTTVNLLDAVGGNILEFLYGSAGVAVNAAAAAIVPVLGTAAAAVGNLRSYGGVRLAGVMALVGTVAAVAASQDTAWAVVCVVWGPAPTFTLAGASTPTLTTNTSKFLIG